MDAAHLSRASNSPLLLTTWAANEAECVNRRPAAPGAEVTRQPFLDLAALGILAAVPTLRLGDCWLRFCFRLVNWRRLKADEPRPSRLLELGQDLTLALVAEKRLIFDLRLKLQAPIALWYGVLYCPHTLCMAKLACLHMGDNGGGNPLRCGRNQSLDCNT